MRAPVLICGMAGIVALSGCAGSGARVSDASPSVAPLTPRAPAAKSAPGRDSQGRVVTLADLTGGNPVVGQTDEGLADSTPGETALEAASTSSTPAADFQNLQIVGEELRGKLAVLGVGSGRTEMNLLSVFAGVKNQTGRRLALEVQTLYRDKDGHPLSGGEASWIPITLKAHEQTQYRSVALSEEATNFVVRIRHASPPQPPSGN